MFLPYLLLLHKQIQIIFMHPIPFVFGCTCHIYGPQLFFLNQGHDPFPAPNSHVNQILDRVIYFHVADFYKINYFFIVFLYFLCKYSGYFSVASNRRLIIPLAFALVCFVFQYFDKYSSANFVSTCINPLVFLNICSFASSNIFSTF